MAIISQVEHDRKVTFRSMVFAARNSLKLSQKDFAERLGFTPQYLCDLEQGRRLGSVEFTNRVCDLLRCNDRRRREWHKAGARAHGWEI